MTSMSRSARNRVSRNSRRPGSPAPKGQVPARPRQIMLDDPHQNGSIRVVGYLGRNPTRVSYSGSVTGGYKSEWARDGYDFYTDARWDQTVSTSGIVSR